LHVLVKGFTQFSCFSALCRWRRIMVDFESGFPLRVQNRNPMCGEALVFVMVLDKATAFPRKGWTRTGPDKAA